MKKRSCVFAVGAVVVGAALLTVATIALTWQSFPGAWVKNTLVVDTEKLARARQARQRLIEARGGVPPGTTTVVIRKSEQRLELLADGERWFSCPCSLGREPLGHKEREGDFRTPEGEYYVCTRNEKSKYHLFLGLSYPGPTDAERGKAGGVIDQGQYDAIIEAATARKRPPWNTPLGGMIGIHGSGAGPNWTRGCIAVDDPDIELLWDFCPLGTVVTVEP